MHKFLLVMLLVSPLFAWAKQCESNYPASALSQGTKPNIHPGVNFVEPPYAGFDPCNGSVDIKINDQSDTFVVVLHGSGDLIRLRLALVKGLKKQAFLC